MNYLFPLFVLSISLLSSCKAENKSANDVMDTHIEIERNLPNSKDKLNKPTAAKKNNQADNVETSSNTSKQAKSKMHIKPNAKPTSKTELNKDSKIKSKSEVATELKESKSEIIEYTSKENSSTNADMNSKIVVDVPTKVNESERKPSPEPKSYRDKVEKVDYKKNVKSKVPNKPGQMKIDHSIFHKLLNTYVSSSGVVNYKSIKANSGQLEEYLNLLRKVNPSELSKSAQLAFWVNAYNAFTIKKIIDHYPISSITDLNGGKPWDNKWIELDGKTLSLNDIENSIIRPQFKEPRIHFAVNCAAQSCPPILNAAYSGGNLNTNFEKSTKAFINNPKFNKISNSKIVISKIFEWYKEDFGDLITFLNKYSNTKINTDAVIEYMDYDWSLNDK